MRYKFLSLFLLAATSQSVLAVHVSLPTISVSGVSAEDTPYALPILPNNSADTGDLVKRLPGANVNKNGAITSIAQYRGLFGNRVNVLVDGTNLHEVGPNSMDSPLSYIAASQTANVAIYRGLTPVSSGIETIGGTMTVTSNQAEFTSGDEVEFHGQANAGYASNGHTRQTSLTANVANRNHRLQVSGSADRGDDSDFDGGSLRTTEFERDTANISYGFQDNGFAADLSVNHLDIGETGTPALPMDIIYVRGETYRANFKNELNNGATLSARLHYQDLAHEMNNTSFRNPALTRFVTPEVTAGGISVSYQQDSWTVGADVDQSTNDATLFNPNMAAFEIESFNDAERDRYSVFAEWSGQLDEQWKLDAGARYSLVQMDSGDVFSFAGAPAAVGVLRDRFNDADLSQDEHLIDLVAAFTYAFSDDLDFEVGLARKTRAPSYQERYLWVPLEVTAGLADGNNYVGDVNLDHEVSYQFELGLDWHTATAGLSPRVFYHHINDYIQGVAGITDATTNMVSNANGDATPLQYSNVDAKLYGIDANWFISLTNEWQLDGTVSYVRGQRRDTSDDLYRISPLTARTMLSYVQTNWRLGFEAETIAKQNKVSAENDEKKTSGYALFNLSGNFQPTDNVVLSAGVNNIFDRYYENHLDGYNRNNTNEDLAVGARIPGLGRSAYINANVSW
ncbi:hypothetical protein A9Q79_02350 [Methylophaga sp. 42_25_T18]|nr:hypothetical protein A9Q79_02350 [Methylophaga sp. 42_25_T18]